MNEIITIKFSGLSGNAYLIRKGDNFVLVDTASKSKRAALENKLHEYGCFPGKLKLIVLTHGDFDHSGNALYLRNKYNCPVAIHRNDSPVTETGNMFVNKNSKNIIFDIFTRYYLGIDKFRADIFPDDGYNLKSFGVDAEILHLPGHSSGSIGVLTAENNLICGDLIENRRKPGLYFVDDKDLVKKSLEKLDRLNINEVYPGHGKVFRYSQFRKK